MSSGKNHLGLIIGGVVVALLICVLAGSAMVMAPLAALAGGGSFAVEGTVSPFPTSGCAATSLIGSAPTSCSIAEWATTIADHLQMCGGNRAQGIADADKCYASPPAPDAMPQAVIDYLTINDPWAKANWVSGNFQCVSLVVAAYGLGGKPLPATSDAVIFWANYHQRAGWVAIPTGNSPQPGTPGVAPSLPQVGDLIVWQHVYDAQGHQDAGHIAIITAVVPPQDLQNGHITVAQANSFVPFLTLVLTPDLRVLPWGGGAAYTALGYIRPLS